MVQEYSYIVALVDVDAHASILLNSPQAAGYQTLKENEQKCHNNDQGND